MTGPTEWPAHGYQVRPWRQVTRGGTAADRRLGEVRVALPPRIAGRQVWLSPELAALGERAVAEVTALDRAHGPTLAALATLLIRTESVASSKIEQVSADIDAYARALHGSRANEAATSMVAATAALGGLIDSAGAADITSGRVLDAHCALMRGDPYEAPHAGAWRVVQNWVGGSDHSPRNALYVPPPPELVEPLMTDLLAFANRDDLPALAQAAIAHAQFESVHPFTDGNGRIGRALVNTILRRRDLTRNVVVPVASALVARRDDYFDVLGRYRSGDIEAVVDMFAGAAILAASEAGVSASRIAEFPEVWRAAIGPIRGGSASARLFEQLADVPVFSAQDALDAVGGPQSSVYAAIERFAAAGVLRPLTDRKRNQIWAVTDMLAELEDLNARIGAEANRR